jgi:S1-C subfamily serine protease
VIRSKDVLELEVYMSEFDKNPLMALSDAMAAAVDQAGEATVLVNGRARMPASGIGFGEDLVLTANHVVEREEDLTVMLPAGREVAAAVAGRDSRTDLAVLRLAEAGLVVARQAEHPARVGQIALALGRPTPGGIQASLGVISAVGGANFHGRMPENFIRTDAIPYPGFSGGPLINAAGEVLGLNTSGLARGMSLAIPADFAWHVAQMLVDHGSIQRGYLGIRSQLVEISTVMQSALGRSQETGLLVMGVEPESPAEKGGLLIGDIVVGLAGDPVSEHEQLVSGLIGDVVGQPVQVEVLRGGQPLTVTVTVGVQQPGEHRRRGRRWRR